MLHNQYGDVCCLPVCLWLFQTKLNTLPASLEYVFICGAFHSLSVLCYIAVLSLTTQPCFSFSLLFCPLFLLFHYFPFFQSLLKPFLMSSYPKPNLLFFPLFKSLRWFIKTDKTPTYFTSQHSEEVFLLLCSCGGICISVRSGVCVCVSDLWLCLCVCIWCGARSRAVSHHLLAPRQQHLHT